MNSRTSPTASETADDWNQHWIDYGDSATLNPAQSYRRRLIVRAIRRTGQPTRILDIGSGQGDLVESLGREWPAAQLAGVEMSASGVDQASRKVPRARFVQRDLLHAAAVPPELRRGASHAVCSEVLEHVDDPVALLRNARSFLGDGAWLVVTVPGGPRSAFDRHIGHRRHYTASGPAKVLQAAGFSCRSISRAGSRSFSRTGSP